MCNINKTNTNFKGNIMSKFIVVEGLDLAGKSSVIIPYLLEKLENTKHVADMKTGKISEKIREIFMDPECVNENTDWRTIAFLASTARSDMVKQEIIPALRNKQTVICDRYVDTSFVYNKKSDTTPIDTILNLSTHLEYPNVIIFAYCSYQEMINRKKLRDDNDQWDISSEEAYNEKLNRYRDQLNKRNCKVFEINTSGSIEETYEKLDSIIKEII